MMAQHFNVSLLDSRDKQGVGRDMALAIKTAPVAIALCKALVFSSKVWISPSIYIAKPWSEPLDVTHIVAQQDSNSAEVMRSTPQRRVESTSNLSSDLTIPAGIKTWLQKQKQ